MLKYFYNFEQIKNSKIKYILSIGRRQPMHAGHKRSLERILSIKNIKLIYVIGSTNIKGDPLFDPYTNPLTLEQQIEQFKIVFPKEEVIFLPILDVADMSEWGPSIVSSLKELKIRPEECAIYFIGKPEDKLKTACSFSLENGELVTLKEGQWLIESLGYYGFAIWFDDEMQRLDLSISARNLRNMDLENLSLEQKKLFAAPEYLLLIAKKARNSNGKDLNDPITLNDLTLERLRV